MDFQCPLYLLRACGSLLVAFSVDELAELLACARDAGQSAGPTRRASGREYAA
jgi:hypothetical protein